MRWGTMQLDRNLGELHLSMLNIIYPECLLGKTGARRSHATGFFAKTNSEVFILSMPLVGVNFDSRRSTNLTDHWWFQRLNRISAGTASIVKPHAVSLECGKAPRKPW